MRTAAAAAARLLLLPEPLDRALQLRDHRDLPLAHVLLLGERGLRLAQPRAELLAARGEARALLACAGELQLREAQLVAQLDRQRLHLLHRRVALVALVALAGGAQPRHVGLRRSELALRVLPHLVQPYHLALVLLLQRGARGGRRRRGGTHMSAGGGRATKRALDLG